MRNGAWNACDFFNGFSQIGSNVSDIICNGAQQ